MSDVKSTHTPARADATPVPSVPGRPASISSVRELRTRMAAVLDEQTLARIQERVARRHAGRLDAS